MRRLFWVAVGVGATVYTLRKVSKVNAIAARFTPGGMSSAVNNLADSLRQLSADFTTSMAENETAITAAVIEGTGPADARGQTRGPEDSWDGDWASEIEADTDDPHRRL